MQWCAALLCATAASLVAGQGATPASPAMSRPANEPGTPVTDPALKKTLETRLSATVDSITRLPVAGLYEVRSGDDVFYADPTGNYIVVGNLIDLRTRENLTRTRVEEIKQASLPPFKFSELPLDAAVKVVKGSGKRRVAIFEDPNCGYCRQLEKSILDIGDVTVYVFLYPVLGPDSLVKSRQVWCAADRAKAWSGWMQNATALAGEGTCTTPLDKTLALGKKLRVDGTPTLFFSNNKRVEGTVETDELERLLAG
jgi:thiol:disulfide interchange protein DsbC